MKGTVEEVDPSGLTDVQCTLRVQLRATDAYKAKVTARTSKRFDKSQVFEQSKVSYLAFLDFVYALNLAETATHP